ncbi:MAG: hypothetical protein IKD29_03420 [Lentisphaeria bacterium]|nr:hypothetical protein [Lentisphaeria bacterium]
MKILKSLFVVILLSVTFVLAAEDIKDAWFDTLYEGTCKVLPKGASASKYVQGDIRIIFIDFPLPISSNRDFNVEAGKKEAVKAIKGTADADYIKKIGCIIVYNYITTDHKAFHITVTSQDL